MKNKQFFVLIILLIIGFASVSTSLIINGKAKVEANLDDFDVVFIEALLDGESSNNVEIDSTKKRLTFSTKTLTSTNDSTRLDYKVKNASTQYDADVIINCTNEENSYVEVTSSFDGSSLPLTSSVNMEAQEIKNGYINAKLVKPTTEDKEILITCTINVNATSRTNYAYSLTFNSNGGSSVEDKTVELNSSYGSLSIPEREGYTFVGWFNELDELVTESTILDTKGNKELLAKWAKEVYEVNIVKNYKDKIETEKINIPYGNKVNVPINVENKYFINNIECNNGYTITGFNKDELIYGNQTATINNNNQTTPSTCNVEVLQGIYEYSYTGAEQEFSPQTDGNYKVELWGAGVNGARGAYTSGAIFFNENNNLFIYVGGEQKSTSNNIIFNSGTKSVFLNNYWRAISSSGATDIRLKKGNYDEPTSLFSRIMVAAGAGANDLVYGLCEGGVAGGLIGYNGTSNNKQNNEAGRGASQINGGISFNSESGKFGLGAQANAARGTDTAGSGGGGYYGGGSGYDVEGSACGGGGSSFISGHNGCNAIAASSTQSNIIHTGQPNHYSGYIFTNTVMIDGAGYNWTTKKESYTGMPSHDGKSTMMGNDGNGFAKITYIGK